MLSIYMIQYSIYTVLLRGGRDGEVDKIPGSACLHISYWYGKPGFMRDRKGLYPFITGTRIELPSLVRISLV
jgi:hypothetical protein